MHGLQPLLAFAETVRRGGFAAAARSLGCTPSSLAKAVTRLEKQLGVRLFHRTTRSVTLTDDGERMYERCQRVLDELEQMQEAASGGRTRAIGTLRINLPVALGRLLMLPLLAQLSRQEPELAIDVRFSDDYVDLIKEGTDLAIRTGTLRDSSLVARRIGSQELLLFAAPSYLARTGTPTSIADLAHHTAVLFRVPATGKDRPFHLRSRGRNVEVMPASRVRVNDGEALVRASALGMGIGQVPHCMVTEHLARGQLVELMPEARPPATLIAAVMPSGRLVPPRVRAFLEILDRTPDLIPAAPDIALAGSRSRSSGKVKASASRTPRR